MIWNDNISFGQAKFVVLSVRISLGQSQFIVQSDKGYPGHATRVWLKTSVSNWLSFRSEAQAEAAAPKDQQHSQPHRSSFSMAARQSFILLLMQNQSGLNNRRSSFAEIDKRTELDCENRPFYTQIFWKVPNSIEST